MAETNQNCQMLSIIDMLILKSLFKFSFIIYFFFNQLFVKTEMFTLLFHLNNYTNHIK